RARRENRQRPARRIRRSIGHNPGQAPAAYDARRRASCAAAPANRLRVRRGLSIEAGVESAQGRAGDYVDEGAAGAGCANAGRADKTLIATYLTKRPAIAPGVVVWRFREWMTRSFFATAAIFC